MKIDHTFYKPAISGAIAAVADRLLMRDMNMRNNILFGVAVAGGVIGADMVSKKFLPHDEYKTLETRLTEVGLATAGVILIDRNITAHNIYRLDMVKRIGVIAGSEILGDSIKRSILNEG